ncbi:MAG: hypothetical protein ACOX0Z_03460 [Candidatus Nanosyncoccaceae bacterium]|jgi:putative Mn2+ efflux pump MntP
MRILEYIWLAAIILLSILSEFAVSDDDRREKNVVYVFARLWARSQKRVLYTSLSLVFVTVLLLASGILTIPIRSGPSIKEIEVLQNILRYFVLSSIFYGIAEIVGEYLKYTINKEHDKRGGIFIVRLISFLAVTIAFGQYFFS